MVMAATRKDLIIRRPDVEEAHFILQNTEKHMPDALGEFGLSQTSAAKQKMLEFLTNANGPVTTQLLWALMQRDLKLVDFHNTLADLVNANKIMQVKTNEGPAFVYNEKATNAFDSMEDDLMRELAE